MATIQKEFDIDAPPEKVWAALRDFGALHEKLAPGFITACTVEGDVRTVTFFSGTVMRERLVGLDDQLRRIAYSVIEGQATHHNASAQVFDAGEGRSRFVWITDVLPDELASYIGPMMEKGGAAAKATLEKG
ncbi:MAG TPA: SRPBCC family protein [Steroidobacteraceae bacterium]|nr:SRPBCC family protein [Steroidobacteraceae bacterium]